MIERRKNSRISVQFRTVVIAPGDRSVEALRPNISWGGIGFFCRDLLDAGTVRVRFTFQGREGRPQDEEAAGNIVWTQRDGNFTSAGISFDSINPEQHSALFSYLRYAESFE